MRIIHYLIGPNRQGGLNRYARDLAFAQKQAGHECFLFYPYGTLLPSSKARIRTGNSWKSLGTYQLLGGLPIPLLEGIQNPSMILDGRHSLDEGRIIDFVQNIKPDVFHIHTWMGFPAELLCTLKANGCKVVFTTHDYFGLCPRVNFINEAGKLCHDFCNEACSRCNANARGEHFLALRNCQVLLNLKRLLKPLVAFSKHDTSKKDTGIVNGTIYDYAKLRNYYLNLLEQCDIIHCNSKITQSIYNSFLPNANYVLLPITHEGITWKPQMRNVDGRCVRLGFSGPKEVFKGLPMLLDVLKGINRNNWHLYIWGTGETRQEGAVSYCGNYIKPSEAFCGIDLLIVPSIWNETFGFIVAESLSLGVPVMCSDTVGAKELVDPSMVFHGQTELRQKLIEILDNPKLLDLTREKIVSGRLCVKQMSEHAADMLALYGN